LGPRVFLEQTLQRACRSAGHTNLSGQGPPSGCQLLALRTWPAGTTMFAGTTEMGRGGGGGTETCQQLLFELLVPPCLVLLILLLLLRTRATGAGKQALHCLDQPQDAVRASGLRM